MVRRHSLRVPLLLASLALFASCAGLSTLDSPFSMLPGWVSHPEAHGGMEVFIGRGVDESAFNARLLAQEDILAKVSEAIGTDVRATSYREFTTTDEISLLGLSIVREYRGEGSTYLMAECPRAKLYEHRSDVEQERLKQDAIIDEYLAEADKAYRSNRDVRAVDACLDALYVAKTHETSHDAGDLLKRAAKYLSALRMSVVKSNPERASCTVRLVRKQVLFAPHVRSGNVLACHQCRNPRDEMVSDSVPCTTSSSGTFLFTPMNNAIAAEGNIVFTINLEGRREKLRPLLSDEEIGVLDEAIASSSLTFPYKMVSPYEGKSIVLNVKQYSLRGQLIDNTEARERLIAYLTEKGVRVVLDADETQIGRAHV